MMNPTIESSYTWEQIDRQEYILLQKGMDDPGVFGSRTLLAGGVDCRGTPVEHDDIYTEWGERGSDLPVCAIWQSVEGTTFYRCVS